MQLTVLPPVEELQNDPQTRAKWIDYSAYDAKATWQLAQALRKQLMVSHALQLEVQLGDCISSVVACRLLHMSSTCLLSLHFLAENAKLSCCKNRSSLLCYWWGAYSALVSVLINRF